MQLLPPNSDITQPDATVATVQAVQGNRWRCWSRPKRTAFSISTAVIFALFLFALGEFFSVRGVVHMLTSRIFLGLACVACITLIVMFATLARWNKVGTVILIFLVILCGLVLDRVFPMPHAAAPVIPNPIPTPAAAPDKPAEKPRPREETSPPRVAHKTNPAELRTFIAQGRILRRALDKLLNQYKDDIIKDQRMEMDHPPPIPGELQKTEMKSLQHTFKDEYYANVLDYRTKALARLGRVQGEQMADYAYQKEAGLPAWRSVMDPNLGETYFFVDQINEELGHILDDLEKLPQ